MNRLPEKLKERLISEAKGYGKDEFTLFCAELGWEDWMNDYTEAPEDEPISESEIEEIDEILKDIFDCAQKKKQERHEAWVMMDANNDVITKECDTPNEALSKVLMFYSMDDIKGNGFTLNKLLIEGNVWLECLEEIPYDDFEYYM